MSCRKFRGRERERERLIQELFFGVKSLLLGTKTDTHEDTFNEAPNHCKPRKLQLSGSLLWWSSGHRASLQRSDVLNLNTAQDIS